MPTFVHPQVIVAMWLEPFYVSRRYINYARQPHKVGREDVEGSYEVTAHNPPTCL